MLPSDKFIEPQLFASPCVVPALNGLEKARWGLDTLNTYGFGSLKGMGMLIPLHVVVGHTLSAAPKSQARIRRKD